MKQFALTVTSLTNFELIEGVKGSAGENFRRIIENARKQWEERFAAKDPSNACVSVRIVGASPTPARPPVPGCGFVKSSRQREEQKRSKLGLPGFAH